MAQWEKALDKKDQGEVGRVYYLNISYEIQFPTELRTYTMSKPFTLNPEFGKTIEELLKSSKEIPGPMKESLLKNHSADAKLSNDRVLRVWLAEEAAPTQWFET